MMVEDIFSGLLEGLAEVVIEVVFEGLGEILSGIADWFSGGGSPGHEGGPVERYKFLPRDLDK
jgi:hypothetical protein